MKKIFLTAFAVLSFSSITHADIDLSTVSNEALLAEISARLERLPRDNSFVYVNFSCKFGFDSSGFGYDTKVLVASTTNSLGEKRESEITIYTDTAYHAHLDTACERQAEKLSNMNFIQGVEKFSYCKVVRKEDDGSAGGGVGFFYSLVKSEREILADGTITDVLKSETVIPFRPDNKYPSTMTSQEFNDCLEQI